MPNSSKTTVIQPWWSRRGRRLPSSAERQTPIDFWDCFDEDSDDIIFLDEDGADARDSEHILEALRNGVKGRRKSSRDAFLSAEVEKYLLCQRRIEIKTQSNGGRSEKVLSYIFHKNFIS